ncbi:MAG: bifunctional folylpolyglutamate synthase/dihydrofolate synthase [Planctomycetaceae bacterium]
MSSTPKSNAFATSTSAEGSASASAAAGFLLGRIDYEKTPPAGNAPGTFRLARMADLLARFDNPQLAIPCVHIAGSKGKGSTAAMTAAMLSAAGYRTGLFTSPHIERFEERIQLNGAPIPSEQFAALVERLKPVAEEMDPLPLGGPTFFELTTALAWLYFAEVKTDIVVLEVGLGGRLDATNLCRPLVTIITSISRDHTKILGDTPEQIASEKAGIIKPGVPVLTGVTAAGPLQVIGDRAAEQGSPCYVLDRELEYVVTDEIQERPDELPRLGIDLTTPWSMLSQLPVPLPGEHQAGNTALAVSAINLLSATSPFVVQGGTIRRGLREVRWPLRIEVLSRQPLLIVDAAHNEASIAALVTTLQKLRVGRRIGIVAISKDKDAATMLRLLTEAFGDLILTRFLGNPRAFSVDELTRLSGDSTRARLHTAETPAAALTMARELATPADMICATGSFFLAAEVRKVAGAGGHHGNSETAVP